MSETVNLSATWDAICPPRIGLVSLTRTAFTGGDLRPLWHQLMDKVTEDAAGAGMGMDLSVISQLLGDQPTGLALQLESLSHQRLYRSSCGTDRPRLRVLAFAAVTDIGGNTPLEFLLEGSDIALATCYVMPGLPLPDPMPDHDIAIVIVPDADATSDVLAMLDRLVAKWPRPVLNLPRRIGMLDRDRLCGLLDGIAGLEIPRTARLARNQMTDLAAGHLSLREILSDGVFPLIARPTGSHAGFGLCQIADAAALQVYLAGRPEEAFFISRFVDYASPDGMFRKYRIVFVDSKPYACHMAIADEWKVWYLNADMAVSVPYRLEEAGFMQGFDRDFAVRHHAALGELSARIGLDYFIIDCAEARTGELLLFEADNSAIVHDMDPPNVYPYKTGQMQIIFRAVQAMFHRRARQAHASAA
jgi:hypothetical protein